MKNKILEMFCPNSCMGCGEIGEILCGCCKKYIISEKCDEAVLALRKALRGYEIFGACVVEVFCVGSREGLLKEAINAYKYECGRDLAGEFA